MSAPTRCLLDKVTARRILEGFLKRVERRDVNRAELFALDLYQRARSSEVQLFIVPATNNVLQGLIRVRRYAPLIQLLLQHSQVVYPARYFTRWARRLRDHGFTREDAAVLALATFGTDDAGSVVYWGCNSLLPVTSH